MTPPTAAFACVHVLPLDHLDNPHCSFRPHRAWEALPPASTLAVQFVLGHPSGLRTLLCIKPEPRLHAPCAV